MAERENKTRPAGINDNIEVTYTNFEANSERTEVKTGEGKEFDNEELLRMLGFKENAQGIMTLNATSNKVEKDEKGKTVRRTVAGRTLTGKRQAERGED